LPTIESRKTSRADHSSAIALGFPRRSLPLVGDLELKTCVVDVGAGKAKDIGRGPISRSGAMLSIAESSGFAGFIGGADYDV